MSVNCCGVKVMPDTIAGYLPSYQSADMVGKTSACPTCRVVLDSEYLGNSEYLLRILGRVRKHGHMFRLRLLAADSRGFRPWPMPILSTPDLLRRIQHVAADP